MIVDLYLRMLSETPTGLTLIGLAIAVGSPRGGGRRVRIPGVAGRCLLGLRSWDFSYVLLVVGIGPCVVVAAQP